MVSCIRTFSATVVVFLFVSVGSSYAQNIVYGTLDASLDTGSLAGTTFQISFSYDADQVPEVGEAYVSLNSFDFTLLGVQFTRNDIFQGGQVIFQDGVPQNITASFQVFLPPTLLLRTLPLASVTRLGSGTQIFTINLVAATSHLSFDGSLSTPVHLREPGFGERLRSNRR